MDTETAISTACDLLTQGRTADALAICDTKQALTTARDNASLARWELVRSWAHQANGHIALAMDHILRSLRLDASNAWAHLQHAILLSELGQSDAHLMALRRCLTINDQIPTAQFLLGAANHVRGLYHEAWQHYQLALELGHPIGPENCAAFAQAADYAGDEAAAQKFTNPLCTLPDGGPNYFQLWTTSFNAFKHGQYDQAWKLYDLRHRHPSIAQSYSFDIPYWNGNYNAATTLLIHGEQGLGDEVMFAASLPYLLAEAEKIDMPIILAVKPSLVALFSFNFPYCTVVPHHHTAGIIANISSNFSVTAHIPLANLPQLFLRSPVDFKRNAQRYLCAPPPCIDHFDQLLNLLLPNRHQSLIVGLIWSCAQGKGKELDARAIPAEQLLALASLPGIEFVSLHNQDHAHEAAQATGLKILDLGLWQDDLSDTAGLIHHMDIVVGVDTACTHLAGAMGKKVLQPLLKYPDWRRQTPGDQCVWYKNTQYLRQSTMYSWFDVLARLRVILAQAQHEKQQQLNPQTYP